MSHKSSRTNKLKGVIGRGKESNKHITKISAKPSSEAAKAPVEADRPETAENVKTLSNTPENRPETVKNTPVTVKSAQKASKSKNSSDTEKPLKDVFILTRPFVAFGRYLRDSWREIRQVRWPNRKTTWKMTAAVLVYCALLMAFILLLDALFGFIFELALGTN